MENVILKELTTGRCGLVSLGYFFYLTATDEGLNIKWVGFIPFSSIEKITSEKSWGFKWIRIIHNSPKMYRDVKFVSVMPNAWLELFEKKGVLIDDTVNVRNCDTTRLKFWKCINLTAGFLGIIAAVTAIVVMILGMLRNIK
jgi:hypothetical protein